MAAAVEVVDVKGDGEDDISVNIESPLLPMLDSVLDQTLDFLDQLKSLPDVLHVFIFLQVSESTSLG